MLKKYPLNIQILVLCVGLLTGLQAQSSQATPKERSVAITIDDLPLNSRHFRDIDSQQEMTRKILAALSAEKVPAIGFVNEGKLYREEKLDSARVELLQWWLDAGMELGNHTYSHRDLHRVSLEEFKKDVIQGEPVTRDLLVKKGEKLRYFRHPYLRTGLSLEIKHNLESFLKERGYTIAPVSIDNSEWIYAAAYDRAMGQKDTTLAKRIGVDYIDYMEKMTAYYEQQSVAIVGYELKQTLLIHGNLLNADYLPALLTMLKKRGYRFISLAEALTDPAYQLKDEFVGRGGITWLHRWAITMGRGSEIFAGEPTPPDFIMDAAGMNR